MFVCPEVIERKIAHMEYGNIPNIMSTKHGIVHTNQCVQQWRSQGGSQGGSQERHAPPGNSFNKIHHYEV